MYMLLVFGVFPLFILSVKSWENTVIVDQKLNVTNDCIQDSNNTFLCATINSALSNLKNDSTVIYIRPGNYTLRNGEETDITGKQDIAIIGSGEDSIITCAESSGLGVLYSVNITIEFIVMKGCGKNYETYFNNFIFVYRFINVSVGLYFTECDNITLYSVEMVDSKGIGILLSNKLETVLNNFAMDSSLIVNGSVSQLSEDSIAGGLVIDVLGSGTIHLSNTSIINNGGGTQSHDVPFCTPIGAIAGIVVIEPPIKLVIESCEILNNTRGFVMYNEFGSVDIRDTVVANHFDSELLLPYLSSAHFSFFEVAFPDIFKLVVPNYATALKLSSQLPDSYSVSNEFINMSVSCPITYNCSYSLETVKADFIDTCSSRQGTCSNEGEDYSGHCPPSYSQCVDNRCSCSEGRAGTLCGQCADGYSVAINSPLMSCVPCTSSTVYKGWALLIALEFIPITVMVAIIAVLNVNLNQGSLSGYIFFCQMITILFPSVGFPSWLVSQSLYQFEFAQLFLLPLSLWNMNFMYYPSCTYNWFNYNDCYNPLSICISQSTTPLAYLLFWYVISFYPLVLALLTYCVVVMYNKGYRCVVCVVRPMHRLLARFWRLFGIQPSLSHTVASLYTLCFTQLAATSLKILHPTEYYDTESHVVFFYDGSQSYFSGVHGFAGTVAILVLVGLFITVAYLLLHPFRLFQKCFGKLKFKKDLIMSVTDVFNGPFKDGKSENSWDYRYFAGMHFAMQLVVMTFYYIPLELKVLTGTLKVTVCSLYSCSIMIFRPYKRDIHTFSEVFLFLLLIVFSIFPAIYDPSPNYDDLYSFLFLVCPLCGFIVIFIVTPYCFFWMIRKCCRCYKLNLSNRSLKGYKNMINDVDSSSAVQNVMYQNTKPDEQSNDSSSEGIRVTEENINYGTL